MLKVTVNFRVDRGEVDLFSLRSSALALSLAVAFSGPALAKSVTAEVGRVGDFRILRTFDDRTGVVDICSAKITSSGREVRFYQHAGDGFGLHFKGGPAGIKGQYVHISVPGGGSISYDAVPINGGWYKAQLDGNVLNPLLKAPEYMEVQFANATTTYMLSRQHMPDVFKAIADCRRRG
jgi:hypothetical protein